MKNDKIEIILNGKKYFARLDFQAIANTQWWLETEKGIYLKVPKIFDKALTQEDYTVIGEIVVESILSCHPQLKKEQIYQNMKFELGGNNEVLEAFTNLVLACMPNNDEDKKKEEENEEKEN